jgi:hypothetical protein
MAVIVHRNTQPGTHEIGYPVYPRTAVDVLEKLQVFAPAEVRTPDRPARSLVTISTELAGSLCCLR